MSVKRFKWKTGIPNKLIHVMGPSSYTCEFTLCGDSFDLDETDMGVEHLAGGLVETKEPLDCPVCIEIIKYCKSIRLPKTNTNKNSDIDF